MRGFPPTLREKKRYLLARVEPGGYFPDSKEIWMAVHSAISSLYGDTGSALMHMGVVTTMEGYIIFRCRRGHEARVACAISTVNQVSDHRVALRLIATSGTMKALRSRIPLQKGDECSAGDEIVYGGKTFVFTRKSGRERDLIEKGFNNSQLLFLTDEDIEEV